MLALLGLVTVVAVLAVIMSRLMTPLVALIALPTIAALIGGFGLATSQFAIAGIQQTAPVAAMFVFAILYFGVMSDAGLMDPIVNGILRAVGTNPTRIVVGSALLALVVHLDGSGAVTFLVAVPALLPLHERLNMDRRVLACVVSMAAGVNFLPWTGPVLRASAALQTPTADLFRPLIPVQAVGLGVRVPRRPRLRSARGTPSAFIWVGGFGGDGRFGGAEVAIAASTSAPVSTSLSTSCRRPCRRRTLTPEELAIRRPGRFWVNC